MSILRTLGLAFVAVCSIVYGIKDGIIGRHLVARRVTYVGEDAFRHGVIMVAFGIAIIGWCGYMLWREVEERRL